MNDRDRSIPEVVAALEAGLEFVPTVFAGRTDAELRHHPDGEPWCAKQVLGHLIEAEGEVFSALIPGILGHDAPAGWDQPPSMVRDECDADATRLLARWRELRQRGIGIARALAPEDLTRSDARNWHRGADETVGELLRHWPEHTEEHVAQAILAIRDAAGIRGGAVCSVG